MSRKPLRRSSLKSGMRFAMSSIIFFISGSNIAMLNPFVIVLMIVMHITQSLAGAEV